MPDTAIMLCEVIYYDFSYLNDYTKIHDLDSQNVREILQNLDSNNKK